MDWKNIYISILFFCIKFEQIWEAMICLLQSSSIIPLSLQSLRQQSQVIVFNSVHQYLI